MSKLIQRAVASMAASSVALVSAAASAQVATGGGVDNFSRNRNTSVQQRQRPAYEAAGIRSGGFLVYPRLEVQVERNDNVYATSANEADDTIAHIRPEVSIESDWNQNFLSAYVRGSINRYADLDGENTDEFGVGSSARIDVTRGANIGLGADYTSSFEPRTAPDSPANAIEPTALHTAQAYISGSRAAGYVKLSGRADWRTFDYQDGRTGAGAVIEQDTRDRNVLSVSGRVDFAISPDTAFFAQATGNGRSYDIASTTTVKNRDSTGAEYLIGANFEVSAGMRGEVAVGYISQDFDEAVYQDTDGFAARAQLEWFPTELTTVTVAGGRSIEDSATPGVGGLLSSNLSIGLDHELLRNVILNGRVSWGRDEYEGIDREDTRLGVNLGATYLINRNLGVNASYSLLDTSSEGAQRDNDFTVNRLAVALVAQF
ncbi:hypothetical protein KKHFBJBL_02070 [Brevundimonas sp. NIBR11]|nr:hypothetical protein KKHFBJBL_02070 [Brevundimonas sp. NIBR11]